jgi:hypothetical protein
VLAVSTIGVVIVVLIVLLLVGGSSKKTPAKSTVTVGSTHTAGSKRHSRTGAARHRTASTEDVALSLKPSAVVYVCLIGDGHKLIPGLELQPGETTPVYHARHFEITLGNNSVTMFVDGIPRTVAPSSQAIGYSITKAYGRRPLTAGQLPTCT